MPIPTRSQSVKHASKAPSRTAQALASHNASQPHLGAASLQAESHPATGLPQPLRNQFSAAHTRSASTIATGLLKTPQMVDGRTGTISGSSTVTFSKPGRTSHQRSSSTFALPTEIVDQPSVVQSLRRPVGRAVPPTKHQEGRAIVKPAFNTFQQHFSPAKPHPPSRAQTLESTESEYRTVHPAKRRSTSRLQDELLQLSLVYQQAIKTVKAYESSVEQKLAVTNQRVHKETEVVQALEAELQKQVNAMAVSDWLQVGDDRSDDSKIDILGFCVNELADITNGRVLDQSLPEFHRWLAKVQQILNERCDGSFSQAGEEMTVAVPDLGPTWSHEVDECSARLRLCQQLLCDLGDANSESGIGMLLAKHQRLADTLLAELETAKDIVSAVMVIEHEWLSDAVATALAATSLDEPVRRGIWSSLDPR